MNNMCYTIVQCIISPLRNRYEVKVMEVCYKKLWKLLIDKDMKKRELESKADIGKSTVAKMTRGEHVSMDVLLKICDALQCDFGDIIEAIPVNKG